MGEECLPRRAADAVPVREAVRRAARHAVRRRPHRDLSEPGPLCIEGEPATCFYVMIDGELVMSKRSGGVDIETNRTSQRGVYFGAWSAYVPGEEHIYEASVRRDEAVAVLRARRRGVRPTSCRREFPMAVHLLEGHKVGGRRQQPDHRPAREAAGARHHHRGPDPSAQQPGRRHRPRRRRPARGRRPDAAQAGDARRRQVQPRRRCASWSPSRTRSPSRWPSPRTWN